MGKKTPFSDKDLYAASVQSAYDIELIKNKGKKEIDLNGKKYTIADIQHDSQTGFDAMAVKDDKGDIVIF